MNPVQSRLVWRLDSEPSGQVSECHIFDSSTGPVELRIVHVPQGVTVTSSLFTGAGPAMKCAALLATALRADGCVDLNERQPS